MCIAVLPGEFTDKPIETEASRKARLRRVGLKKALVGHQKTKRKRIAKRRSQKRARRKQR